MIKNKDTIFALGTPTGKSAIAVFRISGKNTFKLAKKILLRPKLNHKRAFISHVINPEGQKIDNTISTFFEGPKSYTGEDMLEISSHGGRFVVESIYKIINNSKEVRLAEPGEFTRRAFENNKIDLTQAEAVADLIESETELQRKQAISQLEGALTNKINYFSDKIKKILANNEAIIDFVEEELPKNLINVNIEQTKNIIKDIDSYTNESFYSQKLRSGFNVPIIGNPNSGKSSFINYISKKDIAIVTNTPGTTRDVIEAYIDLNGVPIKFYDTAGIRKSKNSIEKIGIKKTENLAKLSDINLVFIDKISDIEKYKKFKNNIYVMSKQDTRRRKTKNRKVLKISSKTGLGIEKLLKKIEKNITKKRILENGGVSRERHRKILENTSIYLKRSLKEKSHDLITENIRLSLNEISKITGKVDIENILEIIFNDFCIGK